jgi:hypothetical protein
MRKNIQLQKAGTLIPTMLCGMMMKRRPMPSLTTCGTSVPSVFARNPSMEKIMNPNRNDVTELATAISDASLDLKRKKEKKK